MNNLYLLLYIALPLILLVGSKFKFISWNEEFMSVSQTKMIQGFMAILIMFHHLSQKTCAPWLMPIYIVHGLDPFVEIGYLVVGVFLFCSGYGLLKSFKTKENYLKGFGKRRILPLLISYFLINIIFIVVRLWRKQKIVGLALWLGTISSYSMPNPNGWYVIAALIFYVAFYLCFKFIKNERIAIISVCGVVFLYCLLCSMLDHNGTWFQGEWWYNSAFCFCFGMLFAKNEDKLITGAKKHYVRYLIMAVVGLVVAFILAKLAADNVSYYAENFDPSHKVLRRWICLILQTNAAMMFVITVLLISMKLRLNNIVLKFMGTITLEFYLIHGLFIEFFGYSFMDMGPSVHYIKNVFFFTLVVAACSLVSAIIISRLNKLIMRSIK